MNNDVLQHLITQFDLDSGAITMLGPVLHQFNEPGMYEGDVLWNEQDAGHFYLWVEESCPSSQVDIDLSNLPAWASSCCDDKAAARFMVMPKGYGVFHVSSSRGGYAVVVRRTGEKGGPVFDGRELGAGDIFAASILRPGRYQLTNTLTGAKGEIVVAYPKPREKPYQQPDPVTVECMEKEFKPGRIRLASAQGQVYQMRGRGRLRIELVEADDGPRDAAEPKYAGFGTPPAEEPPSKGTRPSPRQQSASKGRSSTSKK